MKDYPTEQQATEIRNFLSAGHGKLSAAQTGTLMRKHRVSKADVQGAVMKIQATGADKFEKELTQALDAAPKPIPIAELLDGSLTFDQVQAEMDKPSVQKPFEYFKNNEVFQSDQPVSGKATVRLRKQINPFTVVRMKRLYREVMGNAPTIEQLLECASDATANPEGSAELFGQELTQLLLQIA